jgi:hypothetical protein
MGWHKGARNARYVGSYEGAQDIFERGYMPKKSKYWTDQDTRPLIGSTENSVLLRRNPADASFTLECYGAVYGTLRKLDGARWSLDIPATRAYHSGQHFKAVWRGTSGEIFLNETMGFGGRMRTTDGEYVYLPRMDGAHLVFEGGNKGPRLLVKELSTHKLVGMRRTTPERTAARKKFDKAVQPLLDMIAFRCAQTSTGAGTCAAATACSCTAGTLAAVATRTCSMSICAASAPGSTRCRRWRRL